MCLNLLESGVQVYRQKVGENDGEAQLVYEDLDEAYYVSVSCSSDRQFIFIQSNSAIQNEVLYLRADSPGDTSKVCVKCTPEVSQCSLGNC
jgi:oligopeptidase B